MKKQYKPTNKEYDSSLEEDFHKIWLKFSTVPYGGFPYLPEIIFHHKVFRPSTNNHWEIDFAFPDQKIAIELQGWGTGHLSYKGVLRDAEKHNELILSGWLVLYFMSHHLKEPEHMLQTIWKALEIRGVKRTTNTNPEKRGTSTPLLDLARRNRDKKTTP